MAQKERIIFLDYLRVIACFMVILVHACEFYYLGDGGVVFADPGDLLDRHRHLRGMLPDKPRTLLHTRRQMAAGLTHDLHLPTYDAFKPY